MNIFIDSRDSSLCTSALGDKKLIQQSNCSINSKKLAELCTQLEKLANADKAAQIKRFFKIDTYAANDRFLGIDMPSLRALFKSYTDLSLEEIKSMLISPWNEVRILALLILIDQYHNTQNLQQKQVIYRFLVKNRLYVNNWNLVDLVAPKIIGSYLWERSRKPLYTWVKDKNLWVRRLAIVSTLYFIKQHDFDDVFELIKILMDDREDLIHKACGWMLREVAKRVPKQAEAFLRQYYAKIPRTSLRYAIERFPKAQKQRILLGHF